MTAAADAYSFDDTDGPHIMSWSPAVALAVADWLDDHASQSDILRCAPNPRAINVSRTYLGVTP